MNEDQYSYMIELDYEISQIIQPQRDDYSGRLYETCEEFDIDEERLSFI